MNKMNKKGFTLIEMLVVIAIIAVLVSIIIPTVANSTKKASAAADAANLRSVLAEVTATYLTGNKSTDATSGTTTITGNTAKLTVSAGKVTAIEIDDAKAPACKSDKTKALSISYVEGVDGFDVGFGTWSINDLAKVAEEGGDLPATGNYKTTSVNDTATVSE